jgi:Flp pilus assembly protein TadG
MDMERVHRVLRNEQANSMIEFSLIVSILLLLLLGTLDFGRFLYYDIAIGNAAEVGLQTAMNPCAYQASCDAQAAPQSDSVVMWSAYCEGETSVQLAPAFASCPPCSANSCTPPSGAGYTPCVRDICVSPTGTRTDQQQVQVTVGYDFQPMTVLIDKFFPARSCYTGDSVASNHHTLCALATGRVGDGP